MPGLDDMPAGPELDRLVADKVMGWKPRHLAYKCDGVMFIRCGACGGEGHGNCYGNGHGPIQIKCGEHVSCCDEAQLPEYSTNIARAWEVVEKLYEASREEKRNIRRGWFDIYPMDEKYGSGWMATFRRHLDMDGDKYAHAPTAPLAICRAALKAVAS